MDNKETHRDKAKALRRARREQTKNLDLRTRVANTQRRKNDAKLERKQWKNKNSD